MRGFCSYVKSTAEIYFGVRDVFKRSVVHLCAASDESSIISILSYSPILFFPPSLSSPLHSFIRPHT
jgi:hypothetical protein